MIYKLKLWKKNWSRGKPDKVTHFTDNSANFRSAIKRADDIAIKGGFQQMHLSAAGSRGSTKFTEVVATGTVGNNPRRQRKNFGGQQYGPRRPYDQNTLRIAEETLRMDDKSAALSELFGGLSKDQARKIVHEVTGREPRENPMRKRRRRNPKSKYIRQRIWRTKKRGAKASKRGRKQYKLKRGGKAIFAYPHGKRSSRKLYELLIPKNRSRSRKTWL